MTRVAEERGARAADKDPEVRETTPASVNSHFQMTLPSCGALLGLRIDDDHDPAESGSVLVIFKGEGDHTVSPTIVLDDSEQPTEDTIVL